MMVERLFSNPHPFGGKGSGYHVPSFHKKGHQRTLDSENLTKKVFKTLWSNNIYLQLMDLLISVGLSYSCYVE